MNNNLYVKVNLNADRVQAQKEREHVARVRKQIAHNNTVNGLKYTAIFCATCILSVCILLATSSLLNMLGLN